METAADRYFQKTPRLPIIERLERRLAAEENRMSIRMKALSRRTTAIAPEPCATGIVPAALPQKRAETRSSRSEKIVSGIAISVLLAGFATGILGVSGARGIHPESRVAHIEQDAHWRDR
jgi:hypothetical protein